MLIILMIEPLLLYSSPGVRLHSVKVKGHYENGELTPRFSERPPVFVCSSALGAHLCSSGIGSEYGAEPALPRRVPETTQTRRG